MAKKTKDSSENDKNLKTSSNSNNSKQKKNNTIIETIKEKIKQTTTGMIKNTKNTKNAKSDTNTKTKPTTKTRTKKTSTTSSSKKTVEKKSTTKQTKSQLVSLDSNDSNVSTKKSNTTKVAKPVINEYYDLPYRYNETIIKILAQTPNKLFIYWDISDSDRENFINTYGENFFEATRPVLIVHNTTLNYSFEVEINDFANSWYIDINDSRCQYTVELGRRPIPNFNSPTPQVEEFKNSSDATIKKTYKPLDMNYIYISSSNKIESPNNKILFDKIPKKIYFRNAKTNEVTSKDISSFTFLKTTEHFYSSNKQLLELYRKLFKDEQILETDFTNNPSSMDNPGSSSLNYSSRFNK